MRRKLLLSPDTLEVETFALDRVPDGEGTVLGQQAYATNTCTLNNYAPCNEYTNWPLDSRCADSIAYLPEAGNCTNACPSGPLVCEG